jgi:hypothetical protein
MIPADFLCRLAALARKRFHRTALLAMAIGWLTLVTLVVLAVSQAWSWGGLALAAFMVGGLLGQYTRLYSDYVADQFAAAILESPEPVKTLVALEALETPWQKEILLRCMTPEAAPAQQTHAGTPAARGKPIQEVAEFFSENKWSGGLAFKLDEALSGQPFPALRINALSDRAFRLSELHRRLVRIVATIVTLIGIKDRPREQLLSEPDRLLPYAVLGIQAGVLTSLGTVPLLRTGAAGYVYFLFLLGCIAATLGWLTAQTFSQQKGTRLEFSWALVVSAFLLMLSNMLVLGVVEGKDFGAIVFAAPASFVPALALACLTGGLVLRQEASAPAAIP